MDEESEEKPYHARAAQVPPTATSIWDGLQTYLCIALHLLLVLAHVALVVVIVHHYEHRVTVETGDPANHLSTIVTAVTQTTGTVSQVPAPHFTHLILA